MNVSGVWGYKITNFNIYSPSFIEEFRLKHFCSFMHEIRRKQLWWSAFISVRDCCSICESLSSDSYNYVSRAQPSPTGQFSVPTTTGVDIVLPRDSG